MTSGYRLLSYRAPAGEPQAGVLIGRNVYAAAPLIAGIRDASSVIGILHAWDKAHPQLRAAATKIASRADSDEAQGTPLGNVELLAPILYPGALFCAGANYWDHAKEMAETARRATGKEIVLTKAAEPWFFMKTTAGSIVGPNAPVRLPSYSKQIDWEAEIGVVIARPTRNIAEGNAFDAIAGYLIVNDLSARDLMRREGKEGTPFVFDWLGQKCFEDGAPMGPWITPADDVGDANNLAIKLWVNGVLKQNSNTGQMVHGIAEQIAYLSRHVTLQPGDVIATGTPAGVGMPRGEFLKVGDEVKIEIEGCGTLVNRMVADVASG
jgi:2-keto-4-pentenoate hydratase/2-oxohepta-3-ene-1,7-dioic acid hydratase in catechol pathway